MESAEHERRRRPRLWSKRKKDGRGLVSKVVRCRSVAGNQEASNSCGTDVSAPTTTHPIRAPTNSLDGILRVEHLVEVPRFDVTRFTQSCILATPTRGTHLDTSDMIYKSSW